MVSKQDVVTQYDLMNSMIKKNEGPRVKGLLVSISCDLETSRTSTRSGKEEVEDEHIILLAVHMSRIAGQ